MIVTLVSSAPEVQYVALRNIDLLLQKQPDILNKELRVFFCKYNDPPYVKFQKLEIMVRIANDRNVDQLLAELKEYALEVDMDFVRRAVKAIGQVAIKIESASERCVNTLLDLINTKVNYVVQEAIVVIKDIFRKYPGYEGIIPTLCQCIDELDEPNARAALIWIVGEYAEKIVNAGDILGGFVDGFNEEFSQVRFTLLVSTLLFTDLSRPNFKSSHPSSSSSSSDLKKHKALCNGCFKPPPLRTTTLTFVTEPTSTGVSYQTQATRTPPRALSSPRSLLLSPLSHLFLQRSWNAFSKSCLPYPPYTTSPQSNSLDRVGLAPMLFNRQLSSMLLNAFLSPPGLY